MDKTQIYLGEIQTQITFAKRAFEEYLRVLTASDVPSVFYHAHHFLIHATNIDKLIDVDVSSFRGQYLASLFSGKSSDLKQFRRLRNHLEHFDERLDMWVKNFSGHAFFDMNITTGAKGFPMKAFLRAMEVTSSGFMVKTTTSKRYTPKSINSLSCSIVGSEEDSYFPLQSGAHYAPLQFTVAGTALDIPASSGVRF